MALPLVDIPPPPSSTSTLNALPQRAFCICWVAPGACAMRTVGLTLVLALSLFGVAAAQLITPGRVAPMRPQLCGAGMSCAAPTPANCSGHGRLVTGLCACMPGWSGASCAAPMGSVCSGHGQIFNGRCVCSSFWMGPDCSMAGFSLTGRLIP